MAVGGGLSEVLDWVSGHIPGPMRTEVIGVLNTATAEDGGPAATVDYWRTLAEWLVAKGHLDVAREAIRRWQTLVPADHPIHAVMGGPPPPDKPAATEAPPPPRKEEPNSRIVRVIDTTYTFRRVEPQMDKVQGKKVVTAWEVFLVDDDPTSRAVLNGFDDGTYGPWAVSGVFSDFAGAAAVEVVVRSMQRHYVFTVKKADRIRKILGGFGLPFTAVVGVLIGYVMGVIH
jgi:hypothetical protein